MKKDKKFKLTLNKETLSNMEGISGGKTWDNTTWRSEAPTACNQKSRRDICLFEPRKTQGRKICNIGITLTQHTFCGLSC